MGGCLSTSDAAPRRSLREVFFGPPAISSDTTPLLPDGKAQKVQSGLFGSITNLANTIIGAGILGLPLAMSRTGIALFFILLFLMCAMGVLSIHLLVVAADTALVSSYEDLAEHCFGQRGSVMTSAALIAMTLGALTAYVVLVGDFMAPLVCEWIGDAGGWYDFLASRVVVQLIIVVCCFTPLCLLRSISFLKYTSALSLLLVGAFAVVLTVRTADNPYKPDRRNDDPVAVNLSFDMFYAIAVVAFAFTCQQQVFPIYAELKHATPGRMAVVGTVGVGSCAALYAGAAVLGYLQFTNNTCGNILNNFAANDPLVDPVRVGLTVTIITTYPLLLFPARLTLDRLLFGTKAAFGWPRFLLETAAFVLVSTMLAILAPGVDVVFGFTGAVASVLISYVMPALLFLKAVPTDRHRTARTFATVMLPTGLVLGVLGLIMWVVGLVNSSTAPEHCNLDTCQSTQRETAKRTKKKTQTM